MASSSCGSVQPYGSRIGQDTRVARASEIVFSVDPTTREAIPLVESDRASFGFWERNDLQRWILERPEIIEPDLLVITSEFDRWHGGERRLLDRLDVLFLDSDGALVIAELKRGEAPDTTDLQAIKYASYCAQMTVEDVMEEYVRKDDRAVGRRSALSSLGACSCTGEPRAQPHTYPTGRRAVRAIGHQHRDVDA